VQVLRFKAMTEAGLAAAGAANRHDSLPLLRLLDFGRTRRRLAGLARARRQFGQSILDDYRRRHPRGADAKETASRTMIGDLLRSPEVLDDVVMSSVCLVSRVNSLALVAHANNLQASPSAHVCGMHVYGQYVYHTGGH